jgi:hypothetical protein
MAVRKVQTSLENDPTQLMQLHHGLKMKEVIMIVWIMNITYGTDVMCMG